MARRAAKPKDDEATEDTAQGPAQPWVEDGFRYLANDEIGGFHRCPDTGEALASFYGRGWVDAPKPAAPEPPAPSAEAWVEEGWRYLTHPESGGVHLVADNADALAPFYDVGWVDAAHPDPDAQPTVQVTADDDAWVEDGFRYITHLETGGTTRVADEVTALQSFYEQGWADAQRPTEAEVEIALDAGGWVEDGFRLLVHPETSGSNWVPDTVEALQQFYANGWVAAEKPAPVEETGDAGLPAGVIDEDGFRLLTHPDTGGETRVANTADAFAVFHELGWVDATTAPEPPAQPAEPAGDNPPITENPADTATTEKE